MQVIQIADTVITNINSDLVLPSAYSGHQEIVVQVDLSGTMSAAIHGRISEDADWVVLNAAVDDTSFIQPLTYVPFLRIVTTNAASTPIMSAWVMLGDSVRA